MKDPIELGPDAILIDHGSWRRTQTLGSSVMTQAPSVPKWGAGMAPSQRRPGAMYTLGC